MKEENTQTPSDCQLLPLFPVHSFTPRRQALFPPPSGWDNSTFLILTKELLTKFSVDSNVPHLVELAEVKQNEGGSLYLQYFPSFKHNKNTEQRGLSDSRHAHLCQYWQPGVASQGVAFGSSALRKRGTSRSVSPNAY